MILSLTVEKPKIIDLKPVTKKHPKSSTMLSKVIKQPEIITQPPKTEKLQNKRLYKVKTKWLWTKVRN